MLQQLPSTPTATSRAQRSHFQPSQPHTSPRGPHNHSREGPALHGHRGVPAPQRTHGPTAHPRPHTALPCPALLVTVRAHGGLGGAEPTWGSQQPSSAAAQSEGPHRAAQRWDHRSGAGSAAPGAAFGTRTDTGSRHREPSLTAGTGPPAPLNQNQDCRPASLTARTWQRDHSSGTPWNQEQNRVQGSFALNQDRSTRPPSLTARTGVPGALRTRIRAPGALTWNPGSSTRPPSLTTRTTAQRPLTQNQDQSTGTTALGPLRTRTGLQDPLHTTRTGALGSQLRDHSKPGQQHQASLTQNQDQSNGTTALGPLRTRMGLHASLMQNQDRSTRPLSLRTGVLGHLNQNQDPGTGTTALRPLRTTI